MIKFFDENGLPVYIYQFNPYGYIDLWKSHNLVTIEQIKSAQDKYCKACEIWEKEDNCTEDTTMEELDKRWERRPQISEYFAEIGLTRLEVPYYESTLGR